MVPVVFEPIPSPVGFKESLAIKNLYSAGAAKGVHIVLMYEGFRADNALIQGYYNTVLRHLLTADFVATAHEDVPASRALGKALGCYPFCQFWNLKRLHQHPRLSGAYPQSSIDAIVLHELAHNIQEQRNPEMAERLNFGGSDPMGFLFQALIEGRAEEFSKEAAGQIYEIYRLFYGHVQGWAENNGLANTFEEAGWGDPDEVEKLAEEYERITGTSLIEKLKEICNGLSDSEVATHKDCYFGS